MAHTWLDLSEAKAALANKARRRVQNLVTVPGYSLTDALSGSGQYISDAQALRCSAVLACIRVIGEDVSGLPLGVVRRTDNDVVPVLDHPVAQKLRRAPNPSMTSSELRIHMIIDSLLYNQFANLVMRDARGNVTGIYPLHARDLVQIPQPPLTPIQLRTGHYSVMFSYSSPEYGTHILSSDQLWRGTLLPPARLINDVAQSRALTLLSREAIGLALAAEQQGARLFANGLQTRTAIVSQGDLDATARTQLRESFDPNRGSENSWKPLVLENGVTVTDIGLTPVESQYLESRTFQLQDIARIFRVSTYKLGSMENLSTYGSQEQAAQEHQKSTIQPWTLRIEETGNRDLFLDTESDLELRHDFSQLLKADMQTRFRCWQIGIQSGFIAPNEARLFEGWQRGDDSLDEYRELTTIGPALGDTANDGADSGGDAAQPDEKNSAKQPQISENRLNIALFVLKTEQREASKWAQKPPLDNTRRAFWARHVSVFMALTGCFLVQAQEYVAWRSQQNLSDAVVTAEAVKKIMGYCPED